MFNILLDACIVNRRLDKAIELFRFIKSPDNNSIKLDIISFNTIIKGCAQEKKDKLAFEMFNLIKEFAKTHPGLAPNDVTYNSLIDVCVRSNKMSKAWGLLKEM